MPAVVYSTEHCGEQREERKKAPNVFILTYMPRRREGLYPGGEIGRQPDGRIGGNNVEVWELKLYFYPSTGGLKTTTTTMVAHWTGALVCAQTADRRTLL